MKNNPLVSVIIPTYNRAGKIGTAIRSVMDQTYENVELLIIDDGSDDNTMEIVKQFPKALYFRIDHAGQGAARNFGLKKSRGTLIASLDSDDIWYPDFLMRCITKLENDNLDFVFANWLQRSSNKTTRDYLTTYPELAPFLKKVRNDWVTLDSDDLRYLYVRGCPSPSSSTVLRKSSIISGWSADIYIGDDWCMYLEMILTKHCRAALCMEQLWVKHAGLHNLYDGRSWNEVTDYLYVKDVNEFIYRYSHLLKKDERKALTHLHQQGLLNMAFYNLFKKKNIINSWKLFIKSLKLSIYYTFKLLPNTLKVCFSIKMNSLHTPKEVYLPLNHHEQ